MRKISLISRAMTSQLGKTIAMHIFTNISRSKGDQTMKQLKKFLKEIMTPFNGWGSYK